MRSCAGVALLAGFYGVMVLSLAGTIALFAAARNLGPRVNRVLIGLASVALACFGCYLLWSGAAGWVGALNRWPTGAMMNEKGAHGLL